MTSRTTANDSIRLLDLSVADGPRQLALTEAIMTLVGRGEAPPTLRLYSWSEPVVILGVGQPAADLDLAACQDRGYRVLRRIAGGTAVYHDRDEVSIDLILPAGHRFAPSDVHEGYRQFAGFLKQALHTLGIQTDTVGIEDARSMQPDAVMRPICFASISPYEFFYENRKLNGLCQIRRRDVIAYQTAIYNRFDPEPLLTALSHESEVLAMLRRERLNSFVTDMTSARGEPVDYRAFQSSLVEALTEQSMTLIEPGEISPAEQEEADRLIREKYANDGWTFRR